MHGQDVIAAGLIKINHGIVLTVSNESGHYNPDSDSIDYAIAAFRLWDIPMDDNLVRDDRWALFR